MLARFNKVYEADRAAHTLHAAMAKTEFADLAFVPENAAKLDGEFTIELKTRGITAQMKSGRCWMFSTMNILREIAAEKLGLDDFKLSGNYLAFYDKLEKANNMLEMAIASADKDLDDRMVEYVLDGFGDGGYWDMSVDLVKKYGIVPMSVQPETYQSTHTEKFMRLLKTLLRKDVMELRAMIREGKDVTARKEEMMAEVYKAECIVFGQPVQKFDFSYRDQEGNYQIERGLTPKAFYEKYVDLDLDEYITVTNHPTPGLPMDLYYQFHYIGSMAEGNVYNLNLTQDEMRDLCIAQLKDGEPVWFGCDAGAYGDRKMGVWDPDSLDFEGLLGGVSLDMSKSDRLQSHDSFATHAMILTGVNFDENGTPDRWKIENSWGDEVGKKGYFVCSEKYFDAFVYEAIINKKHLTDAQRALLETEPKVINAWESDTL